MGDFLIDFREPSRRRAGEAGAFLRFFPDMAVTRVEEAAFSLVHTSAEDPVLWAPARSADQGVFAAATGRIALDEPEWEAARRLPGEGGVAARRIIQAYQQGGADAVGQLNGHFTIVIFDRLASRVEIITDRWGLAPCFRHEAEAAPVLSSHPDALAEATGEGRDFDQTSLAEFALTSRVSAPFSYYRRIHSLPVASVLTVDAVDAGDGVPRCQPLRSYFAFQYDPQPVEKTEEVAEELAEALRRAAFRRSLPMFGRTALALSGGLDSRTLLCATPRPGDVLTFCCHDVENEEFRIARGIAEVVGAEFLPLRRSPEFYAENAWQGVKISGGMGSLASNHFLGFREELRGLGVGSLLTGCYWDYLFKGLGFNKQVNRWTTMESAGPFGFSYYARHDGSPTQLAAAVRQRLEHEFPAALRTSRSEATLAEIEHRRLFPLFYEEDNISRSVPQRVLPWYIPFADNAVMTARLKMGSAMKLNRRVMIQVTQRVCGPRVTGIPDANTGVKIGAPVWQEAMSSHVKRVRNRLGRLRATRATSGSWLNWGYYIGHSPALRELWETPVPEAETLFDAILGPDRWHRDPDAYSGSSVALFLRLLTLKIWLSQRS
jgi:asparagine synthase (glutamine-hydrolysing)